jgi:uncharacterized membrane protein YjfL (UPF0719 family)
MAVSLWLVSKVFTWLTPIDEWEELRKGNLGIAIIMAAVVIGFIVVGSRSHHRRLSQTEVCRHTTAPLED